MGGIGLASGTYERIHLRPEHNPYTDPAPWPILVWPVPETGEYVVSYADTYEMATLSTLPEAVRGLMDRVLSGRGLPTTRRS